MKGPRTKCMQMWFQLKFLQILDLGSCHADQKSLHGLKPQRPKLSELLAPPRIGAKYII